MISKVISGGQTGADQGGLRAAYDLRIATGGWAPMGWQTSIGPDIRLKHIYDLKECERKGYAARTYLNVKDSDATIRLAINFNSPGELCTLKAIKKYNKPYLDIDLKHPRKIENTIKWIKNHNIQILNIAGNSQKSSNEKYDIFKLTYIYIYKSLLGLREGN